MTEGTYLDSILSYHRDRAENDLRSLDQLLKEISTKENNRPSFQEKILAEKGLSVIAEIKRRSPSKGCLLYTSPSPRDRQKSRMPSSA